ncbi:uncharacterized protein LOC141673790 [Apium graveolens]|uniref:uncharacterized protein LOC141673790 n=1 Tax=Apium graveolens TaxID=4045 RepID=UPI003D7A7487
MTWHSKQRIEDGKMRHPADSPSWRNIDYRWPAFGSNARNIRLALSADGINPHTNGLTNRYSCWPIVLVTYNLPLWLCIKRKFMMLTILVFGPHEPGNDVDVYLQPLIDDLKKLWEEGEPNVYDAYTKSYFTLKAILLWTINDFPAYGNLFGCVNKGYMCCPVCADDTVAKYLSHNRKMCYQGHRRYLARNHPYRKQKAAFNGQQELGQARQPRLEKSKVVDVSKLDKLQSDVIVTLCELEKIFPASFFDIMIHLIVHLVRELRLCGPVFYRWMYAFERFNKVLKSYVRNRYYPKGCIAECYLGEESVEFCQEFVKQACTTAGLRKDEGKLSGPLSVMTMKSIDEKERDEAHLHVLLNNIEVQPYILMYKEYLEGIHQEKKKSVHWLLREHNRLFADWFLEKVSREMEENPGGVSETIRWIAGKPSFSVLTYEAYLVDGVRYFTKERDGVRVVQNSGVSLVAKTVQVSSAKDLNPVESDLTFYGVILEIWELDYYAFKAPLFLCNWADNDKGIKVDDLGFTLVDLSRQGHKRDKYVSMDQVKQVYYIEDPVDAKWSVVLTSTTRDYQDVYNDDDLGDTTMENPPFCCQIPICDIGEAVVKNIRENIKGTWVKK